MKHIIIPVMVIIFFLPLAHAGGGNECDNQDLAACVIGFCGGIGAIDDDTDEVSCLDYAGTSACTPGANCLSSCAATWYNSGEYFYSGYNPCCGDDADEFPTTNQCPGTTTTQACCQNSGMYIQDSGGTHCVTNLAACGCDPPASGDWTIPDNTVCNLDTRGTLTVPANAHIYGELKLRGGTKLKFSHGYLLVIHLTEGGFLSLTPVTSYIYWS